MDLSSHINQLREDLNAAASVGDENTRHAATLLSGALEPAMRLTLMNALSDLAAEVTTQLDGRVVDVRLEGRDVRAVVSGGEEQRQVPPEEGPPQPPPTGDSGDISRITLRLLDEIKGQAEQAASTQGVSLNTWVARAVQGALHGTRPHGAWGGSDPEQPTSTGEAPQDAPSSSRLRGWVNG
ncbi:HicB family protein [Actinopolyspora xinjiangensis]|uniref:HicB family protein n=1 Tax=Actinopolyspora xinjiangensis TaxID=405564 RepID=A0A1H0SUB1_9ACTN|nr:toxin-antitoxin system HicB family antitoxin [Actinopolyspora xinjiangensis]SDP45331.1 HicB family protein [Actinopolyspora xinjiangensis]